MDFILSNTVSNITICIILILCVIINIIMSIYILRKHSNFLERVIALLTIWMLPLLGVIIVLVYSHFKKLK